MFQFHLRTLLVVVAVGSVLLAGNASVAPAAYEWDILAPDGYGPSAAYVFFRGWPVAPWVFSYQSLHARLGAGTFLAVLLFDAVLASVTVYNCDWLVGWATGGSRRGTRAGRLRYVLALLAGCATVVPVCLLAIGSPDYRRLVLLGTFAQQVAALLVLLSFLAMAAGAMQRGAAWALQRRAQGAESG